MTKKTGTSKTSTTVICEKCGKAAGRTGEFGDVCANTNCHYCGKHIGECPVCGFSLLSDRNTKCPRCHTKITKCKDCGVPIKPQQTQCSICK